MIYYTHHHHTTATTTTTTNPPPHMAPQRFLIVFVAAGTAPLSHLKVIASLLNESSVRVLRPSR